MGFPLTGKPKFSEVLIDKFRKKILILKNVNTSNELKQFRSLNFESLKGDKKGLYSIRVDLKYRLEFSIEKNKISLSEMVLIKDLSNHYK